MNSLSVRGSLSPDVVFTVICRRQIPCRNTSSRLRLHTTVSGELLSRITIGDVLKRLRARPRCCALSLNVPLDASHRRVETLGGNPAGGEILVRCVGGNTHRLQPRIVRTRRTTISRHHLRGRATDIFGYPKLLGSDTENGTCASKLGKMGMCYRPGTVGGLRRRRSFASGGFRRHFGGRSDGTHPHGGRPTPSRGNYHAQRSVN